MIVLKLIKMAPTAGLKMIPQGAKTPAAKGMAKMLYPVAHIKFWTNLLKVRLERLNIANISFGLLSTSTISALSIAISVPAPTAIPTSAFVSAGASLMPSPV